MLGLLAPMLLTLQCRATSLLWSPRLSRCSYVGRRERVKWITSQLFLLSLGNPYQDYPIPDRISFDSRSFVSIPLVWVFLPSNVSLREKSDRQLEWQKQRWRDNWQSLCQRWHKSGFLWRREVHHDKEIVVFNSCDPEDWENLKDGKVSLLEDKSSMNCWSCSKFRSFSEEEAI